MPDVTCPRCWLWQPIGKATRCQACGAPLITPSGLRLDQATKPPPPPPPLALTLGPGGPQGLLVIPPDPVSASPMAGLPLAGWGPAYGENQAVGVDWVLWVRVALAVQGALGVMGLLVLGLVLQHVAVHGSTSAGGQGEALKLGPGLAVVLALYVGLTVVFVWLVQFSVARALLLVIMLLGVGSFLSQLDAATGVLRLSAALALFLDLGFMVLLVVSLVAPRPARRWQ